MSEDISIRVVGLRHFLTLCKIAPYRNSLTYLLTVPHNSIIQIYLYIYIFKKENWYTVKSEECCYYYKKNDHKIYCKVNKLIRCGVRLRIKEKDGMKTNKLKQSHFTNHFTDQHHPQPPSVAHQSRPADWTVTVSWSERRGETALSRLSTVPSPGRPSAEEPDTVNEQHSVIYSHKLITCYSNWSTDWTEWSVHNENISVALLLHIHSKSGHHWVQNSPKNSQLLKKANQSTCVAPCMVGNHSKALRHGSHSF